MDKHFIRISELIDYQHEGKITFYLDRIPMRITARTSSNLGSGRILIDNSSNYDGIYLKGNRDGDKAILAGLEHYYTEKGWHFLSFTTDKRKPERFDIELILEYDEDKELSFAEQTINTLKEELDILDKARRNALNNHNHSDYKLIINNYKQVIELIQELEGSKKPQEIKIEGLKIELGSLDKIKDEFTKMLESTTASANSIGDSLKSIKEKVYKNI